MSVAIVAIDYKNNIMATINNSRTTTKWEEKSHDNTFVYIMSESSVINQTFKDVERNDQRRKCIYKRKWLNKKISEKEITKLVN